MAEDDGLYFMRARFYEPSTGRFLSKDPIEGTLQQPTSLYRYNYANGNPIMYADPDGEFVVALGYALNAIAMGVSLLEIAYYIETGDEVGAAVSTAVFAATFSASAVPYAGVGKFIERKVVGKGLGIIAKTAMRSYETSLTTYTEMTYYTSYQANARAKAGH